MGEKNKGGRKTREEMEDYDDAHSQFMAPEAASSSSSPRQPPRRLLAIQQQQSTGFAAPYQQQQQRSTIFAPPPPPPPPQQQQQGFGFGGGGAGAEAVVRSPRGMEAVPRPAMQQQQQPILALTPPQQRRQDQGFGFDGAGSGAVLLVPSPPGMAPPVETEEEARAAEQSAHEGALKAFNPDFKTSFPSVDDAISRSNPIFDKAEEKLPSKRKAPMLEDEPESKRMLRMKEKQGFEIVTENNSLLPHDMVYSILLRLAPRAIMRFRVVCKRWFRILTDSQFLFNHHLQQQPMPLLCYRESSTRLMPSTIRVDTMDLNSFKSHPIFLFKDLPSAMGHCAAEFVIRGSCDGMLLISHQRLLFLCNPTTCCWTRLPELGANHSKDFGVVGLFCSVGEYRALYRIKNKLDVSRREQPIRSGFSFYVHVLTSQSTKNDRHLGCPASSESLKNELETGAAMLGDNAPTMYNSGLHWRLSATQQIVVFHTGNETFRWMKPPLKNIGPWSPLIEINGKLSMGVFYQEVASLEIWSLVDYDAEAWLLKQKIGLVIPVQNLIKNEDEKLTVYLLSQGNGLLVQYLNYILCCTTNSEVKKIYHLQNYQGSLAHHSLKESLVQHKFLNLSADKIPGDNLLAPFFRTGFPYFKRLQKIKDDEAALILYHQPHQTPGPVILFDALKSIIQKVIVTGEKEAGNAACRVKNYKKAIDHYSEAIKYSYAVLPQRAGAYLQMEKYDECIQDCDVAVEKGREDGVHHGVIARALAIKGYALVKLAKSLKEYDKAIEIVQEALTNSNEASIRNILDKVEKAKQELEKKFSDPE